MIEDNEVGIGCRKPLFIVVYRLRKRQSQQMLGLPLKRAQCFQLVFQSLEVSEMHIFFVAVYI